MRRTFCTVICLSLAAAGCATASSDVPVAQVSPAQYRAYDCGRIAAESTVLRERVHELGGWLDRAAANDRAVAGIGILVWPALFSLGGTDAQEAEYGRIRGEYIALQRAAADKRCVLHTAAAG